MRLGERNHPRRVALVAELLGELWADLDRGCDRARVLAAQLELVEPGARLAQASRQRGEPEAPRRDSEAVEVAQLAQAPEERARFFVGGERRVDRSVEPEPLERRERSLRLRLVQQQDQLVPQPRAREPSVEPPPDPPAREPLRVLLALEPLAAPPSGGPASPPRG